MYALYRKTPEGPGRYRYHFVRQTSLFGCNSGWIPKLLRQSLTGSVSEPIKWYLSVEDRLRGTEFSDCAFIIDLKPGGAESNLSLYEVVNVWGHSSRGWTPIMLHLRGLFIDENPKKYNRHEFTRRAPQVDDPIFSMMYLNGTIRGGKLVNKWTPPGPSPTNSVLIWPDTLSYFSGEALRLIGESGHAGGLSGKRGELAV